MQLIAPMITLSASAAAASPVARQATNPTVPRSTGTFEMQPSTVSEYGEYRADTVTPSNVGFAIRAPGLAAVIRCSQTGVAAGVEHSCRPVRTRSPVATYAYGNGFRDIGFSVRWNAAEVCEGSAAVAANGTAAVPELSCQKANRGSGDFCGGVEFEVPVAGVTGVA